MPWFVEILDLLHSKTGKEELAGRLNSQLQIYMNLSDSKRMVNPEHVRSFKEFSATLNAKDGGREKSDWLAIASKLENWIDYVDEYNSRARETFEKFTDSDVITALQTKISPSDVTNMFLWLQRVPGMRDRADAVLEIKATQRQSMFKKWTKLKKNPNDIFSWMPIGRAGELGPDTDETRWVVVLSKFKDWFDYIKRYRSKVNKFSDFQILEVLVNKRGFDEAERIINKLQSAPDMKHLADCLVLQLRFYHWLDLGLSPAAVFGKIDVTMFQHFPGAPAEKSDWSVVLFELEVWLDYVDAYRRRSRPSVTMKNFKC